MHILTKIVGADFTKFLVKFGGTPPPPPIREVGHILVFSSMSRVVSKGSKIKTIGLPVFEKIGGNVFLFGPLAAERRTVADEEITQA